MYMFSVTYPHVTSFAERVEAQASRPSRDWCALPLLIRGFLIKLVAGTLFLVLESYTSLDIGDRLTVGQTCFSRTQLEHDTHQRRVISRRFPPCHRDEEDVRLGHMRAY